MKRPEVPVIQIRPLESLSGYPGLENQFPNYVPEDLSTAPLQVYWEGPERHVGRSEQAIRLGKWPFYEHFSNANFCAQLTLASGFLIWMARRFQHVVPDEAQECLELAEAVFAYQVDWRYTDRSAGRIHSAPSWPPARSAMMQNKLYMWHSMTKWESYYRPIQELYRMSELVKHILPVGKARKEFKSWMDFAQARLLKHASAPDVDSVMKSKFESVKAWQSWIAQFQGVALPPEILDPEFDYRPEHREELVADFLKGLDWRKNRFLRSPQTMREIGFVGEPYRL